MRKYIFILIIVAVVFGGWFGVRAASVTYPLDGGTGTGSTPSTGDILVGQSDGTYSPQATSTLGLGGGAVAGSNTEIQWNNNGSFGSDPLFIYASSTNRLTIGTSTQSENSAVYILASNAADHVMILRGASSPTAHLFMIESNDGTDLLTVTGTGELNLFHIATANGQLSMSINTDANGQGGITSLFMGYDAGNISIGDDESIIVASMNRFDATGGEIHGLKCLATTGSAEVNCISVRAGINVFEQAVGTFGDMDSATTTAGGDVLAAFISTSTNVTLFASNNDVVIIGDAAQFSEMQFVLATVASGAGVMPTFEFSTSTNEWLIFSPTDGTNGMRSSGGISWELDDIPTWATGAGNEYLIRITRTQVGLSTAPIENIVQISAVTEFKWDKDAFVSMASLNVSGTSTFVGATTHGGNIVSDTDSTDDLGSASIFWRDAYIDKIWLSSTVFVKGLGTAQVEFGNSIDDTLFRLSLNTALNRTDFVGVAGGSFSPMAWSATVILPNTDSFTDLGDSTHFWDETFTDELVLSNDGTGATAANTVRLGGQDLSAGDAGLLIVTENDTEHLFASFVGIATTTPQQLLVVGATGAFTITSTGDVVMSSSTVGRIIISGDEITDFAGRSLTVVSNVLDADAELYTDTKCLWFENPVAADDFKSIYRFPLAETITEIWAESDQTVTFNLQEDDGTPANIMNGNLVPAGGEASTSTFADAAMAANSRLDLVIASVSGTPTFVSICWKTTKND